MTIKDDKILIENLKEKLTLAQQSLKNTLNLFVQRGDRKPLFVIENNELKRAFAQKALAAVDAIVENETRLNEAIENVGKPNKLRRSADS